MGEVVFLAMVGLVVAFLIPVVWRLGEMVARRIDPPKKKPPVSTWTGDIAASNLTPPPKKAQDLPKPPLNSWAARKVMEGANREYFSADRKKTNSEILKEQETNG